VTPPACAPAARRRAREGHLAGTVRVFRRAPISPRPRQRASPASTPTRRRRRRRTDVLHAGPPGRGLGVGQQPPRAAARSREAHPPGCGRRRRNSTHDRRRQEARALAAVRRRRTPAPLARESSISGRGPLRIELLRVGSRDSSNAAERGTGRGQTALPDSQTERPRRALGARCARRPRPARAQSAEDRARRRRARFSSPATRPGSRA